MAADVFAIVSLALPDWIITEEAGNNWGKSKTFYLLLPKQ